MRLLIPCILCLALLGCGLDQTTYRADRPVSAEAASHEIDVPFPSSARNVYYYFHAGGMQELQMFVRFSVEPRDMDGAVSSILADHDKKMQTHCSYQMLSIAAAPHSQEFPELSSMPWWRADSITNGYYRGTTNDQPFFLWADIGQHTIYFCIHD